MNCLPGRLKVKTGPQLNLFLLCFVVFHGVFWLIRVLLYYGHPHPDSLSFSTFFLLLASGPLIVASAPASVQLSFAPLVQNL